MVKREFTTMPRLQFSSVAEKMTRCRFPLTKDHADEVVH